MSEICIYFHRKADTGQVFYVGKGNKRRPYIKERSQFWRNIANKHGYKIEVLFWVDNNILASVIEKYLIKSIGRRDLGLGPLVNQTDGGEGHSGFIQSPEIIEKRMIKLRGKKRTLEQRLKTTGKNNGFYNRTHTLEVCQLLKELKAGVPLTKEHRNSISAGNKGKSKKDTSKMNKAKIGIPLRKESIQKRQKTRKRNNLIREFKKSSKFFLQAAIL